MPIKTGQIQYEMKTQMLTVVMYHYVRDLQNSRYPAIKGLDTKLFTAQVEYLQRHYNPVTMEQVIAATKGEHPLPKKAVLLTFDDGYADHFTNAFPILYNKGVQGSFFAPVKAVTEHRVLDVNKIHFILASSRDITHLLNTIENLLAKYRKDYALESYKDYHQRLAEANRYDTADVVFIKRLLQVELPLEARGKIVDELFVEIVAMSEQAFSRELYMNAEQMRSMIKAGMHIGSHGYDHFWFSSLTKEQQRVEIERSVEFIKNIGGDINNWTICYPYGDYDENTLSLLSQYGCSAGFTTQVKIADIVSDNKFTLSRIDTNDIPKIADATPNEWWAKG